MKYPAMEHKMIPTHRPVLDVIRRRWSPRSFSDKNISEATLETILEAAGLAFSANNLQPWYYVYAFRNTDGFQALWNTLAPGNQPWARKAAVLMISFARKVNEQGTPLPWSQHDLGAANANLALQALSMGIYVHPMAGFSKDRAMAATAMDPAVWEPVVAIALGYPGNPDDLEEPYLSREKAARTRKSVSDISYRL